MNAMIAQEILDLQAGKGRFEDCFSVPEMCDEFVELVLREKWNPAELYEAVVMSVSNQSGFWLSVSLLFARLLTSEYLTDLAESAVLSNRVMLSQSNFKGLIHLLGALAGKGSALAKASLEGLRDQNPSEEDLVYINRCISAYCR